MEAYHCSQLLQYIQQQLPASDVRNNHFPYIAITVDSLLSGVHFPENTPAEWIAHKSLAVNLSDLASMGAMPLSMTLGLVLPQWDESWVRRFVSGLHDLQAQWNLEFTACDVQQGPLSVTVQASGGLKKNSAMLRSAAQPGDLVFVTNTIGDAACALSFILQGNTIPSPYRDFLEQRLHKPVPRIEAGLCLSDIVNAAIDISDGLAADLGHILAESGVGAIIDVDALPASTALEALTDGQQRLVCQLSGGDDYELCFTIPAEKQNELQKRITAMQVNCTQIGEIVAGHELCYQQDGKSINIETHGYDHFIQAN